LTNTEDFEALQRKWQAAWHDLLDADLELAGTDEGNRPDVLPNDLASDYRLIFGLAHASTDTQKQAFALFPAGDLMFKRVKTYLDQPNTEMQEEEARSRIETIRKALLELVPDKEPDLLYLDVVAGTRSVLNEQLNLSDDLAWLLEDFPSPLNPKNEALVFASEIFVTEPLYAMAGNRYELQRWVTSVMRKGPTEPIYRELYELCVGGWQAALGEDALLLVQH
jgi:hypothetical protein